MWTIKLNPAATKALKLLNKQSKQRLESFIDELAGTDNPRNKGKALQGNFKGLWRYRVGDYRLICQIKDKELIILIVEIDHRKDIYK
jgi:mRNA interferase RelE/StbE